jgi:Na+-transporting methylmalonyl-CoA/oxaloacetate decarboxylase gamma subunit
MKKLLKTLSQKWPEYLLEILVLIIGIYGAFAVESWNETRKEQKEEVAYLHAINVEFKENREQFKKVLAAHQLSYNSCEKLLVECAKKQPNPDSLTSYVYGFWMTYTFDPSQSSIESLLSTSSIGVIQNLELRQLLLSWRDLVSDYQEDELLAKDHFYNRIIPYMEDNFVLSDDELDIGRITPQFLNMIQIRRINIYQITDGIDKERKKVEDTMDRIVALTEPK